MKGGSNPHLVLIMKKINEKKEKNWLIKSIDSPEYDAAISEIALALGINPIVAKLLYNRGYTTVELQRLSCIWKAKCSSIPSL